MNKAEFRKMMISRAKELSEKEKRQCDEKIARALFSLEEYISAEKVFAYVGTGIEIATCSIIDKMLSEGKEVYVPLCRGKGEMEAKEIKSLDSLSKGMYGILEPFESASSIMPEKLELIIVPGVAFGKDGSRLGRGGGYYDRFLKKAYKARKIALCRSINTEEKVPTEEHDEYVDIVITEQEIIRIKER